MKIAVPSRFAGPLPRRDILAICVFLNRSRGAKSIDSCVSSPGEYLQTLSDAARMQ